MLIAICDDKAADRAYLRKLLEDYQNARRQTFQIKEYTSGLELCNDKERLSRYQIIFLSIGLDRMDGLKAAMLIREMQPNVHTVLVTSYMDDTLDGYRVRSTHFLLKDELEQSLGKCLDDILSDMERQQQTVRFPFVEGETTLKVDDIIYIETDKHRNLFHTKKGIYSIYRKLGEIEENLAGLDFLRIHQSFLVNMRYIKRISSYIMWLTTGEELSVPKSRYPHVKMEYARYKGEKSISHTNKNE